MVVKSQSSESRIKYVTSSDAAHLDSAGKSPLVKQMHMYFIYKFPFCKTMLKYLVVWNFCHLLFSLFYRCRKWEGAGIFGRVIASSLEDWGGEGDWHLTLSTSENQASSLWRCDQMTQRMMTMWYAIEY